MSDDLDDSRGTGKKADAASSWRQALGSLWSFWASLINRLPNQLFAPEPKALPAPPNYKDFKEGREAEPTHDLERDFEAEKERHKNTFEQRKTFHNETSKTIRRVFYAMVGTSLFCIVTVLGKADAALLAFDADVILPILNYAMGFEAFLVVGPVLLIALSVYLHIFVGQHRLHVLAADDRQPMLPNFADRTAQIAVAFIFYWMVPLTLAVFAWKAYPRPAGPYLFALTLGFAAVMVWLQMRRLSRRSRPWSLPLLYIFVFLAGQFFNVVSARQLDLFGAELSDRNLQGINLNGANLQEAQLDGANLRNAELNRADLSKAQLNGANLTNAKLNEAVLLDAKLNCLMLKNGEKKCVDLTGAELNGANLAGAELNGADLTGAELKGANTTQLQLDTACGDFTTLPQGLTIELCFPSAPEPSGAPEKE